MSQNFQDSRSFVVIFFNHVVFFSPCRNVAYLQFGRQKFSDGLTFGPLGERMDIFLQNIHQNQEKTFFVDDPLSIFWRNKTKSG
ncbi:MAG: hypothetical protein DRH04_06715 [Deltaproteobacteria bacterium]|nr:MAG: hypothetical protein DRH04_06715 [Deltaproteobacteria bacterium]